MLACGAPQNAARLTTEIAMPVLDLDRLRARESSLRKKITTLGTAPSDPLRARRLKKRLRRAQRRRRELVARTARLEKPAAGEAAAGSGS
jgi:hypothetical protein